MAVTKAREETDEPMYRAAARESPRTRLARSACMTCRGNGRLAGSLDSRRDGKLKCGASSCVFSARMSSLLSPSPPRCDSQFKCRSSGKTVPDSRYRRRAEVRPADAAASPGHCN